MPINATQVYIYAYLNRGVKSTVFLYIKCWHFKFVPNENGPPIRPDDDVVDNARVLVACERRFLISCVDTDI